MAIMLYANDVLLVGSNMTLLDDLKKNLHEAFTIKDLGAAMYFLGVEISRTEEGICLSQESTC